MKITKDQVTLLIDLSRVIEFKLGYKIGYTHPCSSSTSSSDDFVIFDRWDQADADALGYTGEITEPQLVVREDMERHEAGFVIQEKSNEFCLQDHKVEALLEEINEALLSGKIFFDPEISRKINSTLWKIKKQVDGRFNIHIQTSYSINGFTQTLEELRRNIGCTEGSKYAQALEFIKEEWPEVFQED